MRAVKWLLQWPGILVALVVVYGLMCCAALVAVVWVKDEMELYPRALLDTHAFVDAGALCTGSDEELVQVASQLLSAHGWEPFGKLTQLRGDMPCGSPIPPNSLHASFTRVDLTGGLPHRMVASVGLDCSTGIASIQIEDEGPGLRRHKAMDLSRLAVGLHEAVSTAEAHGGRSARQQLGSACEIIAFLSDEWRVWCFEEPTSGLPVLTVKVDALSGRVSTEY
jgi:hypothetical protein